MRAKAASDVVLATIPAVASLVGSRSRESSSVEVYDERKSKSKRNLASFLRQTVCRYSLDTAPAKENLNNRSLTKKTNPCPKVSGILQRPRCQIADGLKSGMTFGRMREPFLLLLRRLLPNVAQMHGQRRGSSYNTHNPAFARLEAA